MPLKTNPHPKKLLSKIDRKIQALIKKGTIDIKPEEKKNLQAHIVDIQRVSTYDKIEIKHSPAEGHRVTLIMDAEVLAILDFYYRKDKLYFSIALHGNTAENFVSGLTQLEQRFLTEKLKWHPVLIEPLIGGSTYFTTYTKNKLQLFDNTSGKIKKITVQEFKSKFAKLSKAITITNPN